MTTRITHAYADADDLSDISVHIQRQSPASSTSYTAVNVSNGPKTAWIWFLGDSVQNSANNNDRIGPVTVDGTANDPWPSADQYRAQDSAGNNLAATWGYPIRYDDSLKVDWTHNGNSDVAAVGAWTKGSGPHTAAIVAEGKPVYSVHRNLSSDDVDDLIAPLGYEVVQDPDLSHPAPMTRGAWDEDQWAVADHPYWARYHEARERLQRLARHHGRAAVLDRAGGALAGVSLPNPANGRADPDPADRSAIAADAMAALATQWEAALPDTI